MLHVSDIWGRCSLFSRWTKASTVWTPLITSHILILLGIRRWLTEHSHVRPTAGWCLERLLKKSCRNFYQLQRSITQCISDEIIIQQFLRWVVKLELVELKWISDLIHQQYSIGLDKCVNIFKIQYAKWVSSQRPVIWVLVFILTWLMYLEMYEAFYPLKLQKYAMPT